MWCIRNVFAVDADAAADVVDVVDARRFVVLSLEETEIMLCAHNMTLPSLIGIGGAKCSCSTFCCKGAIATAATR